jgi:acetate kinase
VLSDHQATLGIIVDLFRQHGPDLASAVAVAHRMVHGGSRFVQPTLLDDEVIAALDELSPLAPLHNPPAIDGIRAARAVLPDVPQVAIFDTAFFASLPAEAYTYAIDRALTTKYGVRRYGFHGTSHAYVSGIVTQMLGKPDLKQIVCHLGNGASVSAIDAGRPIDTSLGMTPLDGLVMGTRSGAIDPGLHQYLMNATGMDIDEFTDVLNKRSGMKGLTGMTDMRDIQAAFEAGDENAALGWHVYAHRLVSYIAAYHVLLGGAQAITFTAGIGENSNRLRADVCERLACLGVALDPELNAARSDQARVISTPESAIAVLVVPTNEELSMALQTAALIEG